jgi:hypothetical protein
VSVCVRCEVVCYAAVDGHCWRGHTDTIVRACGRPGVARTLNTREEEEKRQICH